MRKFGVVAVGGTFDQLHKGHKVLLTKAFEVGEHVLIGLCSDEFVNRMKKPHLVTPYDQRLEDLKIFLLINGWLEKAEIVLLNDLYGATLSSRLLEALVVSKETELTAKHINMKRNEMSLPPLQIIVIDMVPSENHAPISTTRIRCGEIDREGHVLKRKNT